MPSEWQVQRIVRSELKLLEIDRSGVGAAKKDTDALTGLRLIASRQDGCKGSGATGFHNDAQHVPQGLLRGGDGFVGDQRHVADVSLRGAAHDVADAAGSQRIGGDATGGSVDRMAGFERSEERRGGEEGRSRCRSSNGTK